MGVFDLPTEIIGGILVVISLIIITRCILSYTNQAAKIRPRLEEMEKELAKHREVIFQRKKVVDDLIQAIAPLREREEKWRLYYEELKKIELEVTRKLAQTQVQEETERKKRIQRKKMGF